MVPNSSTILRTYARQLPGAVGTCRDDVDGSDDPFGPVDEHFRDASVKEILILGPKSVLVRKDDDWVVSGVKFHDADHLRRVLIRTAEHGEPYPFTAPAETVRDVRLPNGFHMTAVVPPEILDASPTAVFVRG